MINLQLLARLKELSGELERAEVGRADRQEEVEAGRKSRRASVKFQVKDETKGWVRDLIERRRGVRTGSAKRTDGEPTSQRGGQLGVYVMRAISNEKTYRYLQEI